MLVGVSLIRNGISLGYPFIPCLENMLACCEKVYVNYDIQSTDTTLKYLTNLSDKYDSRLVIVESEWDLGVTDAEDLNVRVEQCLSRALSEGAGSVLYCQADEVIDPAAILDLVQVINPSLSNIYLERTYFWKDLFHINKKWNINLVRLCPLTPTVKIIEGAMAIKADNRFPDVYVPNDVARIFHYSRIGSTVKIADRLNSLRALFAEGLDQLLDYTFDGHDFEPSFSETDIISTDIVHPSGIGEFYGA